MTTTTELQLVSLDKLVPYQNNARTHSPEQINKLRSAVRAVRSLPVNRLTETAALLNLMKSTAMSS